MLDHDLKPTGAAPPNAKDLACGNGTHPGSCRSRQVYAIVKPRGARPLDIPRAER
jgi:hypothetical protein